MTDQKKQTKEKSNVNPVIAAVTGAVVGAGVAVAGAAALKNEKNRKKVKEVLTNVKDQAMGYMDDMQKQAESKKGEVEGKLSDGKETVKKVMNAAKVTRKAVHKK